MELWNMYGPTETTIWSTVHRVTSADGPIPIGRPIANTQTFVLDTYLNLTPAGTVGELYIGGAGLARGYLGRPELTQERFIQSPFDPHARLYRTGDIARWLPGGILECLGRVDNQVKIRGFRIELGEIEAVLSLHPGIRQCAAIAREDVPGNLQLVAYFEALPGQTVNVSDLRALLEKSLPAYMIPSVFVPMEKLPLTNNGKIDRKSLPAPEQSVLITSEYVPPEDPCELMLARIWTKVLKVERVGRRDNFFQLGGHSLLAVRLVVEIEKLTKVRLPLAMLLQAPTIAGLAELLRRENWKPSWSSLVPIQPGGSKPPLFLMHAHGGNILEYYPLANLLGPDQPVYALQARGLDGHIVKDSKLKDMAAAYITELRSLQPEGPYFLGGFCFGGLLALEVAQQLTAAGQEVGLLAMIQSVHPEAWRFKPGITIFQRAWYQASKRISLELDNLSHRNKGYIAERLRHVSGVLRARMAIAVDGLTGREHQDPSRLPMQYILEVLGKEHENALQGWVPRPYEGRVVLFRASKQLSGRVADQYLGWKGVFNGNLEVREIPGHQQNLLLEPNVLRLAAEFTKIL
jgi:thioesterase domain-containing protein/acyl carrier protein